MAIREGPKGIIDIIRGRQPEPFSDPSSGRSITGELTGTERGGVAPIGGVAPSDPTRFGGGAAPSGRVVEPSLSASQQRSKGRQVISSAKGFINKDVNKIASDLRKNFTNLIRTFTDRNQRLKAQEDLKNDLVKLKNTSRDFINVLSANPQNLVNKTPEQVREQFASQSSIQKFARILTQDAKQFITGTERLLTKVERGRQERGGKLRRIDIEIQEERQEKLREKRLQRFEGERKTVFDLKSGEARFETEEEFLKRTAPFTLTGGFLDITKKGIEKFRGKEFIPIERELTGTEKTLVSALDTFIKFGIFSPLLVTGVAAKEKAAKAEVRAQKTKQVRKTSKKDTQRFVDAAEKAFKEGKLNEQLKLSAKKISALPEGTIKDSQLKGFNDLVIELQKKGLIKGIISVDSQGNLVQLTQTSATTITAATAPPIQTELIIDITSFAAPEISKTALAFTGALTAPTVKEKVEVKVSKGSSLISSSLNILQQKERVLLKSLSQSRSAQAIAQTPLTKQAQKNKQKQIQKQLQRNKQRQKQLQSLFTTQLQQQRQLQQQKQKQKQVSKQLLKQKVVKKIKFIPIVKGSIIGIKKKKKIIVPKRRQGYFAIAKQKGRLIKINETPTTKKKARDIKAFFIDHTLAATGLIRKANKAAGKTKIKVPANYFIKNKRKFRDFRIVKGKRVPLVNTIIEKRKFRLDKKRETQTIQQLRKRIIKKSKIKKLQKPKKIKPSGPKKAFKSDNSDFSKKLKRR